MSPSGREPPIAAHNLYVCLLEGGHGISDSSKYFHPAPNQSHKADHQVAESYSRSRPKADLHQTLINPARADRNGAASRVFLLYSLLLYQLNVIYQLQNPQPHHVLATKISVSCSIFSKISCTPDRHISLPVPSYSVSTIDCSKNLI